MKSNNKQSGTLAGHHNQPAGPITERRKHGHNTIKKNRGCDGRDLATGEGGPGTIQKEIKR